MTVNKFGNDPTRVESLRKDMIVVLIKGHLIPATFSTRDFFLFLTEKNIATFDSSQNFGQNRHEIKKNRSMIRNIHDIKYLRL